MKPKNKLQQHIVDINRHIRPLSDVEKKWIYDKVFTRKGLRTKARGTTCLICGHTYKDDTDICPNCNTKLSVVDSRMQGHQEFYDVLFVTTIKGYQVLRFFFVQRHCHKGKPVEDIHSEMVRTYIAPNGKTVYFARNMYMSFYYKTPFNAASELSLKNPRYLYGSSLNVYDRDVDYVYPRMQLTEDMKRRFNPKKFCHNPIFTFVHLIRDNKYETLHKLGYDYIAGSYIHESKNIEKYWNTLKICFRNKYAIADPSMYFDTLKLLEYFNKDLRNPKYVCPDNLKVIHDKYMHKKKRIDAAIELRERAKKIEEDTKVYQQAKRAYIGFKTSLGDYEIKTLDNVKEFLMIGNILNHCIYTNQYYQKRNTLLLSVNKGKNPLETIELDIRSFDILEARGFSNMISDEHEQVLSAIKKTIPLLRKHYKQNIKTA